MQPTRRGEGLARGARHRVTVGGLAGAPVADADLTGEPAVPGASGPSLWIGAGLAVAASVPFSINLTLVPMAYESGANIHVVNLVRQSAVCLFLFTLLKLTRTGVVLASRGLWVCIGLGVLVCAQFYTLLGTLLFIPVSLAVLLFFTYPFIVAGILVGLGRERLHRVRVAAMLVALAGLGLVLRVSAGGIDARGIALAIATALMFAAFIVMAETVMARHGRLVVMFHFTLASALFTLGITYGVSEGLVWPATGTGWSALAGTAVATAFSGLCLFTAISLVGPLRTAIIDCGSPVWTMLLAFWVLDERMAGIQIMGAAMVVVSIVVAQLARPTAVGARIPPPRDWPD